ncbi:MAG: formate hydrogenlyase maturation HycH family protein [Coriobacteriales bacterium]|jgi:hypothetical protein
MGIAKSEAARKAMEARGASPESLVIGPVRKPEEPMVVFYRLSRKFVDDERSVPSDPKSTEIMYYTLAVGHHSGVIDCFDECLSCTVPEYREVCGMFQEGSHARYKLEGVTRTGEIQVLQEDAPELAKATGEVLEAIEAASPSGLSGKSVDSPNEGFSIRGWLEEFYALLEEMGRDKALYLMGRERRP